MENNQEFTISARSYAKNARRLPQAPSLGDEGNVCLQAAAESTCWEGWSWMLTSLISLLQGKGWYKHRYRVLRAAWASLVPAVMPSFTSEAGSRIQMLSSTTSQEPVLVHTDPSRSIRTGVRGSCPRAWIMREHQNDKAQPWQQLTDSWSWQC